MNNLNRRMMMTEKATQLPPPNKEGLRIEMKMFELSEASFILASAARTVLRADDDLFDKITALHKECVDRTVSLLNSLEKADPTTYAKHVNSLKSEEAGYAPEKAMSRSAMLKGYAGHDLSEIVKAVSAARADATGSLLKG